MKYVFLSGAILMTLLSGLPFCWRPREEQGRIVLTWSADDNPARREQIALFEKRYPEYKLELQAINPGTQIPKLIVQSLAGTGPDLFECYMGFHLSAYVRAGVAMDLTDEFARRNIDLDDVWPCLEPTYKFEGRAYGHPAVATALGLWYNKDVFDEEGIAYPTDDWTWNDFLVVAKKFVEHDEKGRPVRFGLMFWDVYPALGQYGAGFFVPEGTRCALDHPNAIAAMELMQDLIYKHGVMPTPTEEGAMASTGGWGMGALNLFASGKSAMALGHRQWLWTLDDESFGHLRLGVVQAPAAELSTGPSRSVFGGGRSTLVNAKGKNVEGALKFMEFMNSRYWSELINEQADCLAPLKRYCYQERFAENKRYPSPDYTIAWRNILESARPIVFSPYVNGETFMRILTKHTDLVRLNQKPAAEAMREAARETNQAILERLAIDPVLRARYRAAVRDGAPPAWDTPNEAPAWLSG